MQTMQTVQIVQTVQTELFINTFVKYVFYLVGNPGNPISPGLKINFEETIIVKSYFSCSLSSLLDFWVVLEPFRSFSSIFLFAKCHFAK